jgi:3-phenylpropionate/cinnamic acid dioxygenase small subunit
MHCDSCAIKNLIYQYAHHIDNGDLDSVAAMFDAGRIIAVDAQGRETSIEGKAAVLALYQSFTRIYADSNSPRTLHMTTNVLVELEDGGARASATSSAVVFQAVEDFPLQPIIAVRYRDTFTRGRAGWRFEQRRIDTQLTGDLSRHLLRQPG